MKNLPKLRWIIMIVSFIILVFGAYIFGTTAYKDIQIPIFACGKDVDQLIGSSCYMLSHLKKALSKKTIQGIIIFFGMFIAFAILLGRMLCGFICPMGLIQDVIYKIRQFLKIDGFTPDEKTYKILRILKYEILALFIGGSFLGFDFCSICPAIVTTANFGGSESRMAIGTGVIALIIVFIGSFFKRRFFCNICPMGYLIGLFSKFSLFRLKKDCTACTECKACYEACPMGIKSIYTEREKEDITTTNCIMCTECVKKCPEDNAIYMSFLNKKFYVSSRFGFFSQNKKNRKKRKNS